jgi:cell division topological specificity factor
MSLIDFINRLLGRQAPSASTARQRLQLVLAHDRSDLNPELLEQMRREILAVVQKYVEIDLDSGDVSLETEDRVTALVANLPIKRARVNREGASHGDPGDLPASGSTPADEAQANDPSSPIGGIDASQQAPMPAWPSTREDSAPDAAPAEGSGEATDL